ncbi:MAG: DNA protecting protein DprA [Candidatus Altiarchaeales archaeon A3]|nr:MAG: DNA protecting protein DprA [Candidatus Altiarchaeales archaeon A3]
MNTLSILSLNEIPKVGLRIIEKVLSTTQISDLQSPSDLIEILKKANAKYKNNNKSYMPDIEEVKVALEKAHNIINCSRLKNIQIISIKDANYPKYLLQIPDHPVLLHVLGNADALNRECIAIVGTRKPTDYGFSMAKKLGSLFAKNGYVVVSGLAEGIDTAAHLGALDAGGLTIAVVAHGLDTIYPQSNKMLADEIIKNKGAIVSEYPVGTEIKRSYFVKRDRIQSGLSLGVFVVETGKEGGTMHTANFCKKQNRILIVLQHSASGNMQLMSDNTSKIIFKEDNDAVLVINAMNSIKKELLNRINKESSIHSNKKEKCPAKTINSAQMVLNL